MNTLTLTSFGSMKRKAFILLTAIALFANAFLYAQQSACLAPPAPLQLTTTVSGTSYLQVAWTDASTYEDGFILQRKADGSTADWTTIATPGKNTTSYRDNGLPSGTSFCYRVKAYNQFGSSPFSNIDCRSTVKVTIPAAPDNLTAQRNSKGIFVNWNDKASNEVGFKIEKSSSTAGPWSDYAQRNANVTNGTDENVLVNTRYCYRVRAYNTYGNSGYSNIACDTPTVPKSPVIVNATSASRSEITVTWTDRSNNESAFEVERLSQVGGQFVKVAAVNGSSYIDRNLAAASSHCYRIRAINTFGNSAYSDTACAVTVPALPVATPVNLQGQVLDYSSIRLSWNDIANNEDNYVIESKVMSNGSYTVLTTMAANSTNFIALNLSDNTTYCFRVLAKNSAGNSSYSNEVCLSTPLLVVPVSPANLVAAASGSNGIQLTWIDNATNESEFQIERSTGGAAAFVLLSTRGSNATTYTDFSVTAKQNYCYRVRAANKKGTSAYTNTACVIAPGPTATLTVPKAPSNLIATDVTNGIALNWKDNATDEAGFLVERSAGGAAFVQIGSVGANFTSGADINVEEGKEYCYRVRAYNSNGNSAYSNISCAKRRCLSFSLAAPNTLSGYPLAGKTNYIEWEDNASNETEYVVERSPNLPLPLWAELARLPANSYYHSDNTGIAGITYLYRVRAFSGTAASDYSNQCSITTYAASAFPATPTNLVVNSATEFVAGIGWKDNATNESGYKIEYSMATSPNNWIPIGQTGANQLAFSDTVTVPGNTYYFRVYAYNSVGNSAYSNVFTLAIPASSNAPLAPLSLFAAKAAKRSVALSWADMSASETGFSVEYSTTQSGPWYEINQVGMNTTSYVDTMAGIGFNFYRIRSFNVYGYSAYSNISGVELRDSITSLAKPERNLMSARIYPNPGDGAKLTVDLGVAKLTDVAVLRIQNSLGQIVMSETLITAKTALDVSRLKQGLYLLTIQSGTSQCVLRYIAR